MNTFDLSQLRVGRIVVLRDATVAELHSAIESELRSPRHTQTPAPFSNLSTLGEGLELQAEIWVQLVLHPGARLTGGSVYRRGTGERLS